MHSKNYVETIDPYYLDYITDKGVQEYIELNANHRKVVNNSLAIKKSLRKCDLLFLKRDKGDDHHIALDIIDKFLKPILSTNTLSKSDSFDIDLSKLPGIPYIWHGLTTKKQAMDSPMFDELESKKHLPLYYISGKVELLSIDELEELKQRTTFCPSVNFLLKTKFFYHNQNKQLIKLSNGANPMIRYGFVKQYGGVHRFYTAYEQYPLLITIDVSGWDRTCDLTEVYNLRNKHLRYDPTYYQDLHWITTNIISSYCLAPNGLLFFLKRGNRSGGNNTASDNSIKHFEVVIHCFVRIYFSVFGSVPSLTDLLKYFRVDIYSDDNAMGVSQIILDKIGVSAIEKIIREIYFSHHLAIKEKAFKFFLHTPGERITCDFEFLGSIPKFIGNYYVPYPRVGKLSSTIKYQTGNLSINDQVNKIVAIAFNSIAVPELYEACMEILYHIQNKPEYVHVKPSLQSLVEVVLEGPLYFQCLLTGRERNYIPQARTSFQFFSNTKENLSHVSRQFSGRFKEINMASNAIKAERRMEEFQDEGKISEAGKIWAMNAFDPFPDIARDNTGMPTGANIPTIVTCKKLGFNISKPASAGPGNWGVHIFHLPYVFPQLFVDASNNTYPLATNIGNALPAPVVDPSVYYLGLINAVAATDGTNLGVFQANAATLIDQDLLNIALDPSEFTGDFRIIGIGYEVENTTAELQKQGNSTHYRAPQTNVPATNYLVTPALAAREGACDGIRTNQVPANVGSALNYPGTIQWHAKEGCYTTIPLIDVENPFDQIGEEKLPYFYTTDGINRFYKTACVKPNSSVTGKAMYSAHEGAFCKTAVCGSFFTGLSDSTTLAVRMNVYVERAPIINDSRESILVSCAKPSPPRDYGALALYSHALRNMPVSTFYKNNGLGKWFLDAVSTLSDWAAPALSLMPHPIAQAMGAGLNVMNPMIKKYAKDYEQQKELKKIHKPVQESRQAFDDQWYARMREMNQINKIKKKEKKYKKRLTKEKDLLDRWGGGNVAPQNRQRGGGQALQLIPERNRIRALNTQMGQIIQRNNGSRK